MLNCKYFFRKMKIYLRPAPRGPEAAYCLNKRMGKTKSRVVPETKELVEAVRIFLARKGFSTQEEGAQALGVSQGWLSMFLKGEVDPRMSRVVGLLHRMGMDWRDCLGDDMRPPGQKKAPGGGADTAELRGTIGKLGIVKALPGVVPEHLALPADCLAAGAPVVPGPLRLYRVAAKEGLGPWPDGTLVLTRRAHEPEEGVRLLREFTGIFDATTSKGERVTSLLRRVRRVPLGSSFVYECRLPGADASEPPELFREGEIRVAEIALGIVAPAMALA